MVDGLPVFATYDATARAGQPHRQRAGRRARPRAGQPRAAARAEQSDDGRVLARRAQGGTDRGADDAAAAREGTPPDHRQGARRDRALRRRTGRRDLALPRPVERVLRVGPDEASCCSTRKPSARTAHEPTLEALCERQPATFANVETSRDDVCMLAFTSGTTGEPKATMHFHRDVLAMCDTFCRHVLRPRPDDLFIGTPPLAFTFGLGGMLCFPLCGRRRDVPRRTRDARVAARPDRPVGRDDRVHRADLLSPDGAAAASRRSRGDDRDAAQVASRPARRCPTRRASCGRRRPASR